MVVLLMSFGADPALLDGEGLVFLLLFSCVDFYFQNISYLSHPVDNIRATMFVWRLRVKIFQSCSVLCCV